MRGLIPTLEADDIDVLLLNIHEAPADAMLDRFDFRATPTYIIYDAAGNEQWRGNGLPNPDLIVQYATQPS